MKRVKFLKDQIKKEGLFLTCLYVFRCFINKVFNRCVFHRKDISIDYTATLRGLSCIKIGKNFYCGKFLWLWAVESCGKEQYSPQIVIKDNVCINDFVHIGATNYVEIGNNVLMASKIYISDHNHGSYSGIFSSNPLEPPVLRKVNNDKQVIIGDNVWIGEFVSILPGVQIGEGCIIGANSVVTKDIPRYSIAVGNPAQVIKTFNLKTNTWEKNNCYNGKDENKL